MYERGEVVAVKKIESQRTQRRQGANAISINTFNEKPLHAALKAWYAQPGDQLEVPIDGFIIDIVRGELLVEIQTANFSALKRKLTQLLKTHRVRLVHPIAQEKWLVKQPAAGDGPITRRKSPKRGAAVDIFTELVSLPHLLPHPNFSLDVLLIQEEEVRSHQPGRAWRRRGWITEERRLVGIVSRHHFATPADLGELLPADLPEPFTTADLARTLSKPRRLAQQMAYCLRKMEVIAQVGKQGNAIRYTHTPPNSYHSK